MRASAGALVFDVDGVLLDTGPSFTACVLQTASQCAEVGLGPGWTPADVEPLRLAGGFNNDWDAAAALALLGPGLEPGGAWEAACAELASAGGGPDSVAKRVGHAAWNAMRVAVELPFQQRYAGRRAHEVYAVPNGEGEGLYLEEAPMILPGFFQGLPLPFALFTGRNAGEVALALERLGLELPANRVACDEGPEWRKPQPKGLLVLAERLGVGTLAYLGDTVDDCLAAERATAAGVKTLFAGVAAPGSVREATFLSRGAAVVAPDAATAVAGLVDAGFVERGRR